MKQKKPNISAIMIGDGSWRSKVEEYIYEENMQDNIRIFGFLENPYQLMQKSRIFCLTSKWEGFGLVAFEALTLGLPTFVTPVGGLIDIVNEKSGSLCETDEQFINEMLEILNDSKKYKTMSYEAIERSKQIENINDYIETINKIYRKLI